MDYTELLELARSVIKDIWATPQVKIMIAHITINFVVAVMVAIKLKEFELAKIGEFLWRKVVPLVGTFSIFQVFGTVVGLGAVADAAWLLLEATLIGDLTDNLAKLGLNMPGAFRKGPSEVGDDCVCC